MVKDFKVPRFLILLKFYWWKRKTHWGKEKLLIVKNREKMSLERKDSVYRPHAKNKSNVLKENLLTIITIIGVVGKCSILWIIMSFNLLNTYISFYLQYFPMSTGGTAFGLVLKNRGTQWSQRDIMYISYPGQLFLKMLKCLTVPLLLSSISSAIGAIDLSLSKKIAFR